MLVRESIKVREMTGNERKFLWIPAANVNVTARILGDIDETCFRDAVRKLEQRHPLLRTRVLHQDRSAWFVKTDVPEIPVRFVKRSDENQWTDVVIEEHKKPFDPHTGPLIRFIVVYSKEVSEIIIFCQHSICDGTALVYVMRDLLEAVADPDAEPRPLPLPERLSPENLPAGSDITGIKANIRNAAIDGINRKWRKETVAFDREDFENIFFAYWKKHDYRVILLELHENETNELVLACRRNNVTVNSALCGAFLCAYKEINGGFKGNRRNIAVPVDLRQRMKPEAGDVLCLCVGSIMFRYDYRLKDGFWENTKRIHEIFSEEMQKSNLFMPFHNLERIDHSLLESMLSFAQMSAFVTPECSRYDKLNSYFLDKKTMPAKMLKKFSGALPGMAMTNLGKARIGDTYGDLKIDKLYFLPSTGKDIPLVVGAVTINGNLSVSINYIGQDRESMLQKVKERVIGILREA